jgi:UDP-N-acetyl-D-mannosaminuronic acid dehydrogenase
MGSDVSTIPSKLDVVIVGGFGHVGLPLGIVLADSGLQVALYDTDRSKRASIESGKMPFIEEGAEPLLQRVINKTLHISENIADVARARIVIVTVGTPIDEYLNPKTRHLMELCDQLAAHVSAAQCLILRSTLAPGTSSHLNDFFKSRNVGVHIAFCPERIVQGFAVRELKTLPQIISGFTPEAVAISEKLFRDLGVDTITATVQEAEFAKLFCNAWRYIQFAISNQFYMIASEHGADYDNIHKAMTHHYSRAQSFPRAGFAGGPCLLKDTLQLAASHSSNFQLGQAAMGVNEGLPAFVVRQIEEEMGGSLRGKTAGILGMSFKADIDDTRDALSYKLRKILSFHGANVLCSDEYVKDASFVSKEELIARSNVIVIGVPHTAYRDIQIPPTTHVVDLWNVIKKRA